MQIVCGEFSLLKQPEIFSDENEAVLEIKKIINHEDYDPGQPGKERRGPYRGSDIAVYKVDGNKLALNKKELYPACLPRLSVAYEKEPGIFSGWVDPEPIHRVNKRKRLKNYIENYLEPRDTQMEEMQCKDPAWMGSNSYYPPGTVCYRDPSLASCSIFGNSGSSVVRKIKTTDRYSWIGPLSMSKGKYKNIMKMTLFLSFLQVVTLRGILETPSHMLLRIQVYLQMDTATLTGLPNNMESHPQIPISSLKDAKYLKEI